MKKILLTGKDGQVGWELQRALAPLGQVIACGRADLDLASPDAIRAKIREVGPDAIVNAAAYTAVDKAESEPELAMAINGVAPGIMAEEANKIGAVLVHYSTDYVFDGRKPEPYGETDLPNPINEYGRSKLAGERAIADAGTAHLILRTSWVYGTRGKNFLLTMLRLARERDELRIVDDQRGAPTSARLIAEVTAQILCRTGVSGGASGLYHLACRGSATWCGFARSILEGQVSRTGRPLPRIVPILTEAYPLPAARPRNSRLDCGKLQNTFDLTMPAWEISLGHCLDELSGR